ESGGGRALLTGSEGTLACITAVEWRWEPIPADVAGAALGFERLEQVAEAVPYLVALNPSAVELLDRTLLDFVRAAATPPGLPEGLEALLLIEFERETQAAARGVAGDAVRGLRASTAHVATAVDRASLETLWAARRLASPALAGLPADPRSPPVLGPGCVPLERLADYVTGIRAAAAARGMPVWVFGTAGA